MVLDCCLSTILTKTAWRYCRNRSPEIRIETSHLQESIKLLAIAINILLQAAYTEHKTSRKFLLSDNRRANACLAHGNGRCDILFKIQINPHLK